ncbi:MAG: hypothetical protein F6K42_18870 [Leptolyngbya sp. SIO1D8]|nr:hypothetical protein [Leptolyngbya sp. SIO1D8]
MKIAQLSPIRTQLSDSEIRTQLSDSEQLRLRTMRKRLVIEQGHLEALQSKCSRQELTMAIVSIGGALDCIEKLIPPRMEVL